MRAPPAKRPLLFHLRSIGKRLFSLLLFCFSRSGCRGGFGCTSIRSWCLLLLSCITSLMYGMPRSLWSVEFDTYHGASVIDLSILDWHHHVISKTDSRELLNEQISVVTVWSRFIFIEVVIFWLLFTHRKRMQMIDSYLLNDAISTADELGPQSRKVCT
jgi:hypothetical protein